MRSSQEITGGTLNKPAPTLRPSKSDAPELDPEMITKARLDMERLNRTVGRAIEKRGLESTEEINQFMEEIGMTGEHIDDMIARLEAEDKDDPKVRAEKLAFEAMSTRNTEEMVRLAREALALDPDCLDAEHLVAVDEAKSLEDVIDRMRALIAKHERLMGEEYIEENRGHFWSVVETRPYMRALEFLSNRLIEAKRIDEAVAVYRKMLDLNPNDNQGVRDPLLGVYLEAGDLEAAGRLLDQYPDEATAVFKWGRVLERFLAGDRDGAAKAFKVAYKANRHVFDYLAGLKPVPDRPPGPYTIGGMEEAVDCVETIGEAWFKHSEALDWLEEQEPGGRATGPSRASRIRSISRAADPSGSRAAGKLSDAIKVLAEPLLEEANDPPRRKMAITVAVLAWNSSRLPPEKKEEMWNALGSVPYDPATKQGRREFIETLILRKEQLFPGDNRIVKDWRMRETDSGEIKLKVRWRKLEND